MRGHSDLEHLIELVLIHIVILLWYDGKVGAAITANLAVGQGIALVSDTAAVLHDTRCGTGIALNGVNPASSHLLYDAGMIHGLAAVICEEDLVAGLWAAGVKLALLLVVVGGA